MRHTQMAVAIVAVACLSWMVGCGGSSGGGPAGILYVSSVTGDYVAAFDGLTTLTGSRPPDRSLSGPLTDLDAPTVGGLELDADRDALYVACTGGATPRILAFSVASLADGDIVPARRLAGAATTLAAPGAVAVDHVGDVLYVGDGTRILAFHGASAASGNVAPTRVLLLGADVQGLHADGATDRLYVARSDLAIDVFEAASLVPGGPTPPARRLIPVGAVSAWGVAVDNARNQLYVADADANSVLAWNGASTVNGPLSPNRTLIGPQTRLTRPTTLRVDALRNELYVLQDTSAPQEVNIWQTASTAAGDQPPTRALTSGTFVSLAGLALDPIR